MGGNESQSLLYYYISSLKNCVPTKTQNREIYNSGECYFTRGWLLTYFFRGLQCTNYPIKQTFIIRMNLGGFFLRVCVKNSLKICVLCFDFRKKYFFLRENTFQINKKEKLSSQIWKRIWFTFPQPPIAANREALPLLRRKWNVSLCSFFTMGVMRIFSGFAITCLTLVA